MPGAPSTAPSERQSLLAFGSRLVLGWAGVHPSYDPTFPCNDKLIGAWGYPEIQGGEPRDPNLASFADATCERTCSWTRELKNVWNTPVSWAASTSAPNSLDLAGFDNVLRDDDFLSSASIIRDRWVELRVEIDLISDDQEIYYDGEFLSTGSWTNELFDHGVTRFEALELSAFDSSPVYYDDLSLTRADCPPVAEVS